MSGERLILMGKKDVMLQGDKTVIRVTKRGVYCGFEVSLWVRCKKKIKGICLALALHEYCVDNAGPFYK